MAQIEQKNQIDSCDNSKIYQYFSLVCKKSPENRNALELLKMHI